VAFFKAVCCCNLKQDQKSINLNPTNIPTKLLKSTVSSFFPESSVTMKGEILGSEVYFAGVRAWKVYATLFT